MADKSREKYHIEKNTVQETLIIPLLGRVVCSERYPHLFNDESAKRICDNLDYDFDSQKKRMESAAGIFGALEVGQRHFDLMWEVQDYLKSHPSAAVVNLGCGLDNTFSKVDNGTCKGYNIDMPDVIEVRDELIPAGEREENIGCDLNDFNWMDRIDSSGGAVFYAAGVFYYFKTEDVKRLFAEMSKRFPGGVLAFDCCNQRGAKMMMKTWLKEAGITDVGAFFSLSDASVIKNWSDGISSVSTRSYMRGYRDIYRDVRLMYRLLIKFCDNLVDMNIVKVEFKKAKV